MSAGPQDAPALAALAPLARASDFAIAAVVLVAELALSGFLLGGTISAALFLMLHIVVAALPCALLLMQRPDIRRQTALLAIATVFMGVIGAAGAVLALVLERPFAHYATPFHRWRDMLFGYDDDSESASVIHVAPGSVSNLSAFSDVLDFGTTAMKLSVVALIGREFRPVFAATLQKALKDSVPAVRVQAAAVAAALEHEFHQRQSGAENDIRRHGATAVRFALLADIHADFAASGLLEDERSRGHRNDAERAFRAGLELDMRNARARRGLGLLLAVHGAAQEAAALLQPLIAAGSRDEEIVAGWCQAMLRLGDGERLRAAAAALSGDAIAGADTALGQALALWLPEKPATGQTVRA